ncbi:M4 family metallopeptidase [Leifsonia sp. YAF41]|uniref:M4 family metallopeptidase n=1 Tax=Leifsonia sp. YAF41 TaxID=3233086 RepID=UPI003F9684F3
MTGTTPALATNCLARCTIVPPYLLVRLARLTDPRFAGAAEAARQSLLRDQPLRELRVPGQPPSPLAGPPRAAVAARAGRRPGSIDRTVADAGGRELLPGRVVRREGQPPVADTATNEAYDGLGSTHLLFWTQFQRDSIDGAGLPLNASVHYGERYDNAFWNGERMVFGDGDGQVFNRFTLSLTVIGHELTHGVVQHTANLNYQGQSGALNESIADVFGSLVEQFAFGQSTSQASWLIGQGLFTDEVEGTALRSLKAPGTAYNDDVLGKDPQPSEMAGYVDTELDNGGVHLNSGIPNRAFYLVADALGGNAWESPGQIWYDALTGGRPTVSTSDSTPANLPPAGSPLPPDADFAAFARATETAAVARFGADSAERQAVVTAWRTVGVAPIESK